jgi:hypothetical protein
MPQRKLTDVGMNRGIRQQREHPRPLNSRRQLALMEGAGPGNPAGNNLTTLGDKKT